MGEAMSLGEAARLAVILRMDPSSMTAAALEDWDHPVSREALILMDQFDLDMSVAMAGSKRGPRPKPHPGRPWKASDRTTKKHGDVAGRSRAEVVAILNAHGHSLPV